MSERFENDNNPLRAGIVKRLVDYRWSSYPAYAYSRRHHLLLGIVVEFKGTDTLYCLCERAT